MKWRVLKKKAAIEKGERVNGSNKKPFRIWLSFTYTSFIPYLSDSLNTHTDYRCL